MEIIFNKYQGTGNDFIVIDNRKRNISLDVQQIATLCNRRFGIGADGLMLLETADGYDFKMVYYNADGNESTMCGNGGRCIAAFARKLGLVEEEARFIAVDGIHRAILDEPGTEVQLQMTDVHGIQDYDTYSILNTGSPHYVLWVEDVSNIDVYHEGKSIRNQDIFQPKGINVNFAQVTDKDIAVRTYERGVEDETLSCGTGVTAVAIASARDKTGRFSVTIQTPGGSLHVRFEKEDQGSVKNVWLTGSANFVYQGSVEI